MLPESSDLRNDFSELTMMRHDTPVAGNMYISDLGPVLNDPILKDLIIRVVAFIIVVVLIWWMLYYLMKHS